MNQRIGFKTTNYIVVHYDERILKLSIYTLGNNITFRYGDKIWKSTEAWKGQRKIFSSFKQDSISSK